MADAKVNIDLLLVAILIMQIAVSILLKKRIVRRWGVRPINQNRKLLGEYETLFQEIQDDDVYFFKYTRMNFKCFNYLLKKVMPLLLKRSNRQPLTPGHRLTMTLKYLASGSDTFSIASSYRVGESTVRMVIMEICIALIKVLAQKYLKTLTREDWLRICKGFEDKWNLPNCGGSVDGKHIEIKAPPNSGSLFFNYKKTYSLVLMAVCDFEYKFTLVDIGAYGSSSDGGIFEEAALGEGLFNGTLNFPEEQIRIRNSSIKTSCFLAADNAFPLSLRLMKSYSGSYLNEKKKLFNYRLSRGRRMIENSFGILASRWRILYRSICADPQRVDNIIMAVVCLHNFLMTINNKVRAEEQQYCPSPLVDQETEDGRVRLGDWRFDGSDQLESFPPKPGRLRSQMAYKMRDTLAEYFVSPAGRVPWQEDYVRRGQNRDN